MRNKLASIALAGLALWIPACSAEVEDRSTGATEDGLTSALPSAAHPGVVLVHMYTATSGGSCTGELIAPRVVLTAAHCFSADTKLVRVLPGYDLRKVPFDGKEGLAAPRVIVHEKWDGDARNGNDLALIQLEKPLTTFEDTGPFALSPRTYTVTPLPIRRTPLTEGDVGRRIALVGYGRTINGVTGIIDPAGDVGEKRIGAATIGAVSADKLMVGGYAEQCPGDSGGPVLETIDGKAQIIGISSYSDVKVGEPRCSRGMNTRLDAYASWIDQSAALLK